MITNIPKHWKIKKLGEIGKVKMCKRIFKDQTNKDSNGIPFYKIGTFGGIPDAFISKELYNEYKNKYPYPKKGDVLISAAGTIGRLVVFDGTPSYFQDSNIIWIENDENIALNKYLYHLYSNVKWKTTEGGIVSRLYNADVESLELPIPPLKEQEKIAEILLSCDKAIRLTTQIITQLKQRNQGLAQQLLTGEKRVKGFEKSVWKEVRLGEIGFFFKGKGVSKNKIIDKGFKCLTYGDLYTKYNFVIKDIKSFIDKETALISQEIRYGDICFAGSGETLEDIGKCATFIDDEIGYAGGDIIVFRTEQNPIVMSYLLNSDKAIRLTTQIITQLKQRNQGLAQQLLTGEKRVKGFEKSVWKEVRLGDLLDYEQPTNYLVKNTDYSDEYKTPVLTAGKTFILGYTNEKEGICTKIPLILFDDFTTDSRYIDFPFKVKSSAVKLLKAKKNANLRFIFEAMKLIKYAIGGHERHWISKYAFLTIFVPSFKEQNAIAQIIDTALQELKLYEQKLQLLQAQKKTLMQKLLTGEVLTIKK